MLVKAIAQAIPTHAMQCFSILVSILKEMEKLCRSFFGGQKKEERKMAWVSWEKICGSKREGGLGMRNVEAFNKAMLAKQAWRVFKYPNSLMAKVLKNKYFPKSSFMEVKVSPLASYTWKSILCARKLLGKGVPKVVGNGQSIDLWCDPWIPTLPMFRVIQTTPPSEAPRRVADVMVEGRWKTDELRRWLSSCKIKELLKIPIPLHPGEDKWSWYPTKHGEFSVRSAYFMEMEEKKKKRGQHHPMALLVYCGKNCGNRTSP